MNLPVVITKENHPGIWIDLMIYLSMSAVLRAAMDKAIVPQNQMALDTLIFLETVRTDYLHDQLWSTIHKELNIESGLIYECHPSPDFKSFTLTLASEQTKACAKH